MSKNISHLAGRKGLANPLFEQLGQAAEANGGTPSPAEMERLREAFLVGKANVYGAASFYDFMRPENQGKKVYVCNGSACLAAGTQGALAERLREHFQENEIGEMCCLGRCYDNSAFHYQGRNYSGAAAESLPGILKGGPAPLDRYHVGHSGTPILTAPYPAVPEYYGLLEACFSMGPEGVLEQVQQSGLRGRGGAGFSMAFKLASCRAADGDSKFVVCNADEGDPGAYSDRYIMEERPHALLLGMMIAAYAIGSRHGVLYIRAEYPESIAIIEQAVAELRQGGYLSENIRGSGFDFDFKIIKAQGAYICGEETALLSSLEGQRPEVRVRPPYPTQQGLFNQPTIVNNVETLANLPFILKQGGKAFAAIGTAKSTGTKLLSLDSFFRRPGIYEVDMGTPLQQVIEELGGGFKQPVKAMHIGGPLGGLVPVGKIGSLTVDFDSFAREGFLLGHASVLCIPESMPLIQYLEHLFAFTAHESCGKCFPCRLGSTRGAEMLRKAQENGYRIDRQLMDDLLDTLERGSLCALGGGLPLPVKNALQYFESELAPYFKS